jgi:hypothetical protein
MNQSSDVRRSCIRPQSARPWWSYYLSHLGPGHLTEDQDASPLLVDLWGVGKSREILLDQPHPALRSHPAHLEHITRGRPGEAMGRPE